MSEEPPSTGTEIAVVVQDSAWFQDLREVDQIARRAARAALCQQCGEETGPPERTIRPVGASELTVVLADDRLVRRLNREYRGQDRPTNVLSFSGLDVRSDGAPDMPQLLGDVVLARETVFREARAQNKAPGEHLSHLVVHGVLHLLGFDHDTDAQAESMESAECAVLAGLGIADPYQARRAAGAVQGSPGRGDD